jgi:hypothetical protein
MKFASCTDRADSDGGVGVKKKPSSGTSEGILIEILISQFPHCTGTRHCNVRTQQMYGDRKTEVKKNNCINNTHELYL